MWKRCRSGLTLRVFLLTFGLLLLVCAAVGGLAVRLAPKSHAVLLENRLDGQMEQLLAALESAPEPEWEPLLTGFSHKTGAQVCLLDENGQLLYSGSRPLPETLAPLQPGEDGAAELVLSVEEDTTGMVVLQQEAGTEAEQIFVVEEEGAAVYRRSCMLAPADGGSMQLVLTGSMEAVRQTAQALYRLLPWLGLLAFVLSLLAAFVFARFVTRPVVALSRVAQSMAAQDFSVRWQGGRGDEIGMLGNSLNTLSDDLSAALSRLREANAALEAEICREKELEKQRSAFFAAASHELKTPVTILKGQISGMLEGIGPYRDRDRYLARTLSVAERMESLIREMLTISRLEAGECSMAQVDLSALAKRLLEENRELAESREIMVEAELQPGITLRGNEALLRNALDNLLMNGLLYSPRGESLRVRLREGCLSVENTGAALPEDVLPRLFDPFFRVEGSRSRTSGGSGLGLYLVGCIARRHGMRVRACNTENGVCFQMLWDA